MSELRDALLRFRGLAEAVDPSYSDDVVIRCEVTAGDIRAMIAALETTQDDKKESNDV